MERAWGFWRFFMQNVLGLLGVITTLGGVGLAVLEVFRRYVLGTTFYWGVDAVTYFILSGIFLYFGVTQLKRSHLTVDLILEVLRRRGQDRIADIIKAVATSLTLMFTVGLLYFGLPALLRTRESGRNTMSLVFPLWWFQAALYVGLLCLGITLVFQVYNDIRRAVVGEELWEEVEVHEEL